ncbi:ATPase [Galdieria sulphuraria]|uniref:ATPase n=1 Tax=Galdieria sulphuraria TaxID=130081 RepID=M2XPD8_GALSU|nr:ATPase [Galdieria sulphuraria]EME32062.1 ATPase [Galdieria sulphuraria]|eukprot:XP_005708582.1 ATPase [Galdieria sulphuraria]
MATRFSSEVHYGSAVDWIYAYGKYLDSPLKNILVSAPTQKPILLIIDDADHWVVGKKSLEKKTMCGFIEELDSCRNLQQRILWILITREENQLHPILRRDEYFPHSFCVPSLSRENIHHMVSYWLEKIDNPTISRVALDLVQRENMIPGWKGCVFGHISYLVTTFLRMVYCKGGDHDSIAKQWQRSLEATFSFVVQNNPEIGISNHKPSSNFIVDDFLVGSDDESSLSETFNDLVTVITYSMKKNQQVFPTTVTPFRGALIYGPCGVGKTSLCHRLVQKLHLPVFVLDGASLLASAIGQSEKTLKQCFLAARRFSPCVIFVDQIDMVFQKRDFADGTSAESLSRLTCLFLSEMDGFSTSRQPEFFVLATAQDLDKIDPALLRPGRLEYKKKLDLPTNYQRYRYLCNFLKHVKNVGVTVEKQVEDNQFLDWIVQSTCMWNLADWSMLLRSVLLCCWKEKVNDGELKRKHFESMLMEKQGTSNLLPIDSSFESEVIEGKREYCGNTEKKNNL